MATNLTLERHSQTGHSDEDIGIAEVGADYENLGAFLEGIRNDWSATVRFERSDAEQLFVSASNGHYAVLLLRGDEAFDLVGDPSQGGTIEFVHGGQPAPHPARHVAPASLALEAARAFLRNSEWSTPSFRWEPQE
jgi:hypothetical protein